MSSKNFEDQQLIHDCLTGREHFVELYARINPMIISQLRRLCIGATPLTVDDSAQALWVRLLLNDGSNLKKYDPKRGALTTFMSTTTFNFFRELSKKNQDPIVDPSALDDKPSTDMPVDERLALSKELQRLREHLEKTLSAQQRAVMAMHFFDGRSASDIAALLGKKTQIIYNDIYKIREAARAFVKKDEAP